jgi:hypothetical protein
MADAIGSADAELEPRNGDGQSSAPRRVGRIYGGRLELQLGDMPGSEGLGWRVVVDLWGEHHGFL